MPRLKCDVRNCSHNQENYCCLSMINVEGERATNVESTCCSSYTGDEYVASNCSQEPDEELEIKCSAIKCIHNYDQMCTASAVDIGGASTACSSEDTQCGTFVCS